MTQALTNTGLNLPNDCTEEEFFEAGKFLAKVEHGMQWAIGDWYNAIPWSNKQAACERAGLGFRSARSYSLSAIAFQQGNRLPNLSFKHHQMLSLTKPGTRRKENEPPDFTLSDDQRTDLLKQAEEHKWSSARLVKERDKVLGKPEKIQIPDYDAKVETMIADLPKSTSNKVKGIIKNLTNELKHRFQDDVERETKERVKAEQARLADLRTSAQEDKDRAAARLRSIDGYMTLDEFNLIRNCLHPDRQPEEKKERYGKAFDIFNRLEATVNIHMPIAHMRNTGWDKKSPKYKG